MTPSIPSIDGNAAAYPTVKMSGKNASDGMTTRLVLAAQFAAAWLDHCNAESDSELSIRANTQGIAQADDLIAQLNRDGEAK